MVVGVATNHHCGMNLLVVVVVREGVGACREVEAEEEGHGKWVCCCCKSVGSETYYEAALWRLVAG